MSKKILVEFPDRDHLAISLGYADYKELLKEYPNIEKAVKCIWSDFGGQYTAKVLNAQKKAISKFSKIYCNNIIKKVFTKRKKKSSITYGHDRW